MTATNVSDELERLKELLVKEGNRPWSAEEVSFIRGHASVLLATLSPPLPSTGVEREDVDALRYVLNFADSKSHVRTVMNAFTLPERLTVKARLERLYAALSALPLDGGLK
jgi:hypothetical protein